MPEIQSLALCLSPREIADFLPGPLLGECRGLAHTAHAVDTPGLGARAFAHWLLALDPDVIVAGWSIPVLPDVLPVRLRCLCYRAGSIKRMVRREHLERGLIVSNWGRSISRTMAEGALLLALAALRRAGYWVPAMHRDGAWKNGVTETASLFGRRVGLHGFGNVARELIRLLRSSALRGLPDVTLFPHLAGPTSDRRRDAGALGRRNLRAYVRGEPLESVVGAAEFDSAA